MAKYYGYEKGLPRRGFVRKALDDVVAIEEAWISELDKHFMREGYDELLSFVALTLKNKMNTNVSRAQAWILLKLHGNQRLDVSMKIIKYELQPVNTLES